MVPLGDVAMNFNHIIFKLLIQNSRLGTRCETTLMCKQLDLTNDKSILVQVMAWCRQATSHYLSRCWPRSRSYGITRHQWVKKVTYFESSPEHPDPFKIKIIRFASMASFLFTWLITDVSIATIFPDQIMLGLFLTKFSHPKLMRAPLTHIGQCLLGSDIRVSLGHFSDF